MPLRICFVASEVTPLAKTGGLADVAGVLPRHLQRMGHDVRIFMPRYSALRLGSAAPKRLAVATDVPLQLGVHAYQYSLLETVLPGASTPIYLVDCPALYDRPALYSTASDEHLRFLMLQRAALDGCQRLQFAPDIVQCNDWHTALLPMLLKSVYAWDRLFASTRTVMSIHNIGYQGVFDAATVGDIGSDVSMLISPQTAQGGAFNWLREGVRLADRVSTVSPTYAQEICTPLGGHGLDVELRARPDPLVGILNGVDYSEWDPATDRYLEHRYSAGDFTGKFATKRALLQSLRLSISVDAPLIGIVSRLTVQKGFDLLFDTLPEILTSREIGLVALGSGEPHYESFFAGLARSFSDRVAFQRGYSDKMAHLIEAASDMFLMPSMYEPCGLNQMYSLKYGTIPIVRRTGGLADSVQMWDHATQRGDGVVFNDFDASGIRWGIQTALDLFRDKKSWRQMMLNGMARDFSWDQQAREYAQLYEELAGAATSQPPG